MVTVIVRFVFTLLSTSESTSSCDVLALYFINYDTDQREMSRGPFRLSIRESVQLSAERLISMVSIMEQGKTPEEICAMKDDSHKGACSVRDMRFYVP